MIVFPSVGSRKIAAANRWHVLKAYSVIVLGLPVRLFPPFIGDFVLNVPVLLATVDVRWKGAMAGLPYLGHQFGFSLFSISNPQFPEAIVGFGDGGLFGSQEAYCLTCTRKTVIVCGKGIKDYDVGECNKGVNNVV